MPPDRLAARPGRLLEPQRLGLAVRYEDGEMFKSHGLVQHQLTRPVV